MPTLKELERENKTLRNEIARLNKALDDLQGEQYQNILRDAAAWTPGHVRIGWEVRKVQRAVRDIEKQLATLYKALTVSDRTTEE